jgi:hypothetical protein
MPKAPKVPPNSIERITPDDRRLPPGLFLPEPCDAEVLPDGRIIPLSVHPAVIAFYYPDLAMAGVTVPTFADVSAGDAAVTALGEEVSETNRSPEEEAKLATIIQSYGPEPKPDFQVATESPPAPIGEATATVDPTPDTSAPAETTEEVPPAPAVEEV